MTVLRICYFNRCMITFVISVKADVQTSFVAEETFSDESTLHKKKVYFLHYELKIYIWRNI